MAFRYPFRKYQRLILAHLEQQIGTGSGDRRYHLVAPPGSGKTIIGLELIRRFGAPAVVFAPTTTIQQQWRDEVGMFVSHPEEIREITSLDPAALAPINIFTYQLIAATGEADDLVRDIARKRWAEDLLLAGQAPDEEAAIRRLESLQANNPKAYGGDLSKRVLRVKRDLLRREDPDVARFLHPNARKLIDELVIHGVRTVVLDECHHLLDYWAIVLRDLIARIENPDVVGLTATLPSPEDGFEYENYMSLLGEVDFEVPTPAVVKEGDLAPYRDLAAFVKPTPREHSYLLDIQGAFETSTASLTADPRFIDWVTRTAFGPPGSDPHLVWETLLRENTPLAVAGLRFLHSGGLEPPAGLAVPTEAEGELALEDWAVLLERYGLDELKPSADAEDHERLTTLRRVLRPFGFTLTERGLRQSRSPGDLVLSYSESKVAASADILMKEAKAMGDRLRAVLVTDFERTGASRRVEALDPEAGSARHVFLALVSHPEAGRLEPVLVTGKTLWIDADHGDQLIEGFNEYLVQRELKANCRAGPTRFSGVLEVLGEGRDWSTRTYVAMVTAAFERGTIRCLVGTRGLFAEGWDALTLNTLIDLTTATTATSVQQLRGRSIRRDPAWPRKVAHNWDVICVAKGFDRGDGDLRRFMHRHQRVWGVVPASGAVQREHQGRIVKGVFHVDPELATELFFKSWKQVDLGASTRRMLREIPRRDKSYELWGVGEDYSNFSYTASRLEARDLRIRTVYTVQETLRRMVAAFRSGMAFAAGLGLWYAVQVLAQIESAGDGISGWTALGVGLAIVTGVVIALNARTAWRIGRRILREQPPDSILLDVGKALLRALQESQLVSPNLQPEYLRVVEQVDLSYEVFLDYASPEDAETFIRSYREIFEPVVDQRYLIQRSEARLPRLWLAPVWAALRRMFRPRDGYPPAYHPVPRVLATRRERAESLARHWRVYVGGGELIYTRGEQGWRLLVAARAQRRPKVKSLAFEVWR